MKARTALSLAILVLLAAPLNAQVKHHTEIKFPRLPEQKLPQPEVYTLDNGLRVFLIEDHELPLIGISGRIRTGSNYEPSEKAGMGEIFGQVMREGGTTSMDGDSMDDFLESRAASVETGVGGDVSSASMSCLKEDFDEVLAVYVDVLRNPAFAQDKIDLAKRQVKTGIARRNDEIAGIARREFARLIYGKDSPLGRLTEYATLASIARADLVAWHRRYYHPNNITLGIRGDFDSTAMKQKIARAFSGWERGPDADLPAIGVEPPEPGVYFVEKGDVAQAYIRMGHIGIRRDNPDYYAVQVLNEVFGGGFSARLYKSIRTDKGLAYSVGGGIQASYLRKGSFGIGMSTKSETMAESVDALLAEIDRLHASPPTDHEIELAREGILNSWVFNSASLGQILGQQLTYDYYGYPPDSLERYRKGIEKVTTEDLARVARKYIHQDKLVILVAGKSADFDRPVSAFGPVTVIDITIPAPPSSAPALTRSTETLAAGATLLARSAAATLGSAGPAKGVEADYTIELSMGGQTMAIGQKVAIEFPDKLRQTISTPMGEQVIVINGSRGAAMGMGQSQALSAAAIEEELADLNRDLLVIAARHEDVEANAGEASEVDGEACSVVEVSLDGVESVLCLAEDGRPLRQSYQGSHPLQGTPGELEAVYSDFRDSGGYLLPYKRVIYFDGEIVATITAKSMTVNPDFDASTFEVAE